MSKLLYNKRPLVIDPQLATLIGVVKAIVLQQIKYWLVNNKENGKNLRDGHYWTYNSYANWQKKNFPFFSVSTVKRAFQDLEKKDKLLISANYNKMSIDRTKWYRIDKDKLDELEQNIQPTAQIDPTKGSQRPNQRIKKDKPIPEINTENTNTENTIRNNDHYHFVDQTSKHTKVKMNNRSSEKIDKLRVTFDLGKTAQETWYNAIKGNVAEKIIQAQQIIDSCRKSDPAFNAFHVVTNVIKHAKVSSFNILSSKMCDWNSKTKELINRLLDAGLSDADIVNFTKWRLENYSKGYGFVWHTFLSDTFIESFVNSRSDVVRRELQKDLTNEQLIAKFRG